MALTDYRDRIRPGVLAWLDSVAETPGVFTGRWKYNLHMHRPWAVESSAMAVMVLDSLGELSALSPARRQGLVEAIGAFQDPATGHFVDPLISEANRAWTTHTWEHIWHHHTGTCVEALEMLGAAPPHPLPASAFEPLRAGQSARQVLELGWSNPWLVGEHFYRMVICYRREHPELAIGQCDNVLEPAFAALESQVLKPTSGLPDALGCQNPRVAAAGLFKVLFGYLAAGRRFPLAERAIDSVLALQVADGGFGMDDMCVHWDCLWSLRTLNRQLAGSHRRTDIHAAADRLAEFYLREHRRPDGAFSFYRTHCIEVHDSIRISDSLAESDMLGTCMVCDSLREMD